MFDIFDLQKLFGKHEKKEQNWKTVPLFIAFENRITEFEKTFLVLNCQNGSLRRG